MGDIQTTSGSKFWISTDAALPATDTLAEYEALTWVEIGMIEDLGEVAIAETAPRQEGNQMHTILSQRAPAKRPAPRRDAVEKAE